MKVLVYISILAVIFISNPVKGDLSREESMILGLKMGPNSAGTRLASVYRESENMMVDLNKALTQVHVVSKSYGKLKHKPQDYYFANTDKDLNEAINTLNKFQDQLVKSHKELKSEVESVLLEN